MTPSVEVFNTAVQQHSFNDDPLLDLSNNSDEGPVNEDNQHITKPGDNDVLLGRGGGTNNHSGNIRFRKLVNEHKMRYLACSKVDKPKVAREVVQLWRKMTPPGRFLTRKDETKKGPGSVKSADNVWYEVGDKKAREKASQCLRERTPDVMPYIKHLREQQDAITEQGVSLVQKQLQMQQQQQQGGQKPMSDFSSPGTSRNTLNVQAFQQRMAQEVSPLMGQTSPQAQYAAKMAAAGMGHPGLVQSGGYPMQGQHSASNLHGSMSSVGHASFSSHGGQPVTAAELYGDVECYDQGMMMAQQQVHMQQMQMRQMQQQRMQQMQQQQHMQQQQQQQMMQQQQQMMMQRQQQQQMMHNQQQQQQAAVSAASLFQDGPEPEPYAVQSDPLFVDLGDDTPLEDNEPRPSAQQKAPMRPALKQKRSRDAPEERKAPERAPTAASLMSINTTPDGGEITIEEYRKQLEEYIENNQLHSSLANNTDDDDDECPSDLEDDWEKEREKNMQRQDNSKKRGVGRNVSGCSFMSAKTTKSGLSMVSGISTGMFSEGENSRENMRSSRSLCSSLSLMSELTDLSENLDNLGLDD